VFLDVRGSRRTATATQLRDDIVFVSRSSPDHLGACVGSKGKRVLTADQVRIRLHLKSGWMSFPARKLDIPTSVVEEPGR